ncbi:hypothetical protein ACWEP2_29615, partial [Streptomyces sp. NPDC004279]
ASYIQIRGRVVRVTTDGASEHIESLAQKYLASMRAPPHPGMALQTESGRHSMQDATLLHTHNQRYAECGYTHRENPQRIPVRSNFPCP